MNGRVSDGGVWQRCQLRQLIDDNQIGLPNTIHLPYHIIAVVFGRTIMHGNVDYYCLMHGNLCPIVQFLLLSLSNHE